MPFDGLRAVSPGAAGSKGGKPESVGCSSNSLSPFSLPFFVLELLLFCRIERAAGEGYFSARSRSAMSASYGGEARVFGPPACVKVSDFSTAPERGLTQSAR